MSEDELKRLSKIISEYMDEVITLIHSDHFPCEVWITRSVQGDTFVVIEIEGRRRIHRANKEALAFQ